MRPVAILIVITLGPAFPLVASAQVHTEIHPFDTLRFDRVVAYDYDGAPEKRIVKDGQLQQRLIRHERDLTNKQVRWVNSLLGDSTTYGGGTAACFDPHLGLVYYRNGAIVAHVSICLDCNYLESSARIPAMEHTPAVWQDNSYFKPFYGFSKQARKKLSRFCSDLDFDHCKLSPAGMFD